MSAKPILVLQMQRMGDLVLSFPLLTWLRVKFPGHPIWVVAEEVFYSSLLKISPEVVYFPYSESSRLKHQPFAGVINLSHRPEAAKLAGELKHDFHYGALTDSAGITRISGPWQIYRASLVRNNRHNRFHWGDLNALDVMPGNLPATMWPKSERSSQRNARIGLFVGASQAEKRPDPAFFAALIQQLLERGHKPVLLGGPADKPLAAQAAALAKAHALNLCGHFSISDLVLFLRELDLLITPDTGPMHVAVWAGTPVLNLSMGNVNAWETGPSAPGHYIVRSALSCVGCWDCRNKLACHKVFTPECIARIAHEIVCGRQGRLSKMHLGGVSVLRSARRQDAPLHGLYDLQLVSGASPRIREAFSNFWQTFFYSRLNSMASNGTWIQNESAMGRDAGHSALRQALLAESKECEGVLPGAPEDVVGQDVFGQDLFGQGQGEKLFLSYNQSVLGLCRLLSPTNQAATRQLLGEFWEDYPPFLRPLSSFCQLWLANNDYSTQARAILFTLVESALL